MEEELQKLIGERSNPRGVTVQSVEMRDVIIPGALQDAMSRAARYNDLSGRVSGIPPPEPGPYSCLSATIGSTFVARLAGM